MSPDASESNSRGPEVRSGLTQVKKAVAQLNAGEDEGTIMSALKKLKLDTGKPED